MAVWNQAIGGQQQAQAANQAQMQQVGAQKMAAWQQAAQGEVAAPPNWVDTTLGGASSLFAGYANVVTVGYYNQWIGNNAAFINTNSALYTTGQAAGCVWWGLFGTSVAWGAAGGPTYNVGIQFGGNPPFGFHTIFGVTSNGTTTWAGAVGPELGAMGVWGAPSSVVGSSWTLTGIPTIFPGSILPPLLNGAPAWSCITAAGSGFVNGLLGPYSPFHW